MLAGNPGTKEKNHDLLMVDSGEDDVFQQVHVFFLMPWRRAFSIKGRWQGGGCQYGEFTFFHGSILLQNF
ncbi:hypothetical protein FIM25_01795 [Desulfobotulus mexicanus]|uniref:Uncharacterized protein n=1 Tax=Desulfobotulus mexicanus TaxID=2586642 RepID=A0A5Q4VF35_9BACT|nr:hypothetical protein FIM25_01795 [Desulfobotulus mexicanus]